MTFSVRSSFALVKRIRQIGTMRDGAARYAITLLFFVITMALQASALQDGLASSPPMGWRSWNLYGTNVNQDLLLKIMRGMTKKRGKERVSLCDLGYCQVGLDDNWQKIMQLGPKQCTYHDEAGSPMINSKRFPNLKSMTNYGHKLGLKVGWYFNNCYECHEKCPVNQSIMSHNPEPPRSWNPRIYLGEKQGTANERCYEGDVKALIDYGFDGVKLDACGWQMDLDLWQRLIQEHTKDRPVLIEACHWGRTVPEKPNYVIDESNATIDMGWCPFHYWRTSGDIWASYGSIIAILQHSFQFEGLSRPGCWAHLDMLEVGCAKGPNGQQDVGLTLAETRTHFAAWAIMSSPLFLSHDITNETVMEEVWPIISNTDIIAINQAWAGFSGGPFWLSQGKLRSSFPFMPLFHKALYLYKPLETIEAAATRETDRYSRVAVLLINSDTQPVNFTLNLLDIPGLDCATRNETSGNCTINCAIRDVWKQESLGIIEDESMIIPNIESHDCAFFIVETPRPNGGGRASFFALKDYLDIASFSGTFSLIVMVLLSLVLVGQRISLGTRQRRPKII